MKFKKNIKSFFLILILSLLFVACEDSVSGTDDCKNECDKVNVNECNDKSLMVCEKDSKGCFVLKEVEVCKNSCENNACTQDTNCSPLCKEWETCSDAVCDLSENRCNLDTDCINGKVCDVAHNCVEKTVDKTKKTKFLIGTGKNINSSSFKMKLNVGKVNSIKKAESANFKMKIGNSTIDKK